MLTQENFDSCLIMSIWGCEVVGEPLQPPGTAEVFDACPATSSSLSKQPELLSEL